MYLALGAAAGAAASTALDILSSLAAGASGASKTGIAKPGALFSVTGPTSVNPLPASAGTSGGNLSPATFNALLTAQDGAQASATPNPTDSLKDLLSLIDGNGDGKVSKAEFEDKLGAGGTNVSAAGDMFAKLDADGDGSVTLNEMSSALRNQRAANVAQSYSLVEQLTETQTNALATAAKRSISLNV